MLPRCYLKASGAERPGYRGLLFWILAVSLPRNLRHNWDSSEGAPPGGQGEEVFSRGMKVRPSVLVRSDICSMLDWAQSPPLPPRHFTRPCTRGHTPLPSHMEMRYLCSYAAASKNGPTGCQVGVFLRVFEATVLPKTFLLLKRTLLFGLLLFCSVPNPQRRSCEQTSLLPG